MMEPDLASKFLAHEAVCAERWKESILRIKRLESILLACAGSIILLLLHLVTKAGS